MLPIKYLTGEKIIPTDRTLQMWSKTELKPKGTCHLTIRNPKNDKKYSVEFMAVQENLMPLLGARAIQHMGIVKICNENFEQVKQIATKKMQVTNQQPIRAKRVIQIIEEFSDVFDGELGTLQGEQHLKVDQSAPAMIAPSRRAISFEREARRRVRAINKVWGYTTS